MLWNSKQPYTWAKQEILRYRSQLSQTPLTKKRSWVKFARIDRCYSNDINVLVFSKFLCHFYNNMDCTVMKLILVAASTFSWEEDFLRNDKHVHSERHSFFLNASRSILTINQPNKQTKKQRSRWPLFRFIFNICHLRKRLSYNRTKVAF